MSIVIGWGAVGTLFQATATATVDVGSSANRVAYVWIGNVASTSPAPVSVTVGSDNLASSQAQLNGATGKYRLYYGALTVTGSQTVTATMDSSTGQVMMCGIVLDGVDTGTLIESYAGAESVANNSWSSGSLSSSTGDICVALLDGTNSRTLSPTGSTSVLTGTGLGDASSAGFRYILYEAGAASVAVEGDFSGIQSVYSASFNVPATGGGAATLPQLEHATGRGSFRGQLTGA